MLLNKKGSVTVFLSIVLPVIILLGVVVSDIYLFKTGQNIIKEQLRTANASVLGNYSKYLKDNYDIYGYCISDYKLKKDVYTYLTNNLSDMKLYDFKIEKLTITKKAPMTNINILENQIENIMKDSIYKTAIKEIYDRLYAFESLAKIIDVLKTKYAFDEKVKTINDNYKFLKKLVEGGDITSYVNIFNSNSYLGEAINEFYDIYEQINDINTKISILKAKADETIYEVELLLQQKGYLKEQLVTIYNEKINEFIITLINTNEKALFKIEKIILDSKEIYIISNTLQQKVNDIPNTPQYLSEIIDYSLSIVHSIEKALFEEAFEQLQITINGNIKVLQNLHLDMEQAYNDILNENDIFYINSKKYIEEYNSNITIKLFSNLQYGKGEDKREFFKKLGKRVLRDQMGDDIVIDRYIKLPSQIIKQNEIEVFDVDVSGDSTKDVQMKMNSLINIINKFQRALKDEVYLNEYILLNFSNITSKEKKLDQSYFNSEIEYILFGSKSQNTNIILTKSALMLMRFALNTAHVYSDGEKQTKANIIATTIAGWWTFGAGIPVISNLISCAWAIAEAGIDVRELVNGEALPIYKLKGDWKLDIGLNQVTNKTPDILKIDYEDYMRILLLSKPKEDRLKYILDLIHINGPGNFNISNTYCGIDIKVVISQRSLLGKRHFYEIQDTLQY